MDTVQKELKWVLDGVLLAYSQEEMHVILMMAMTLLFIPQTHFWIERWKQGNNQYYCCYFFVSAVKASNTTQDVYILIWIQCGYDRSWKWWEVWYQSRYPVVTSSQKKIANNTNSSISNAGIDSSLSPPLSILPSGVGCTGVPDDFCHCVVQSKLDESRR